MIFKNQKAKVVIVRNILGICLCWLSACTQPQEITQKTIDLPQIRDRNSLVVVTDNHPVDYFIFNGEPMGFQYEVLSELGNYLGVEIEIRMGKNQAENLADLLAGRCDMVVSEWLSDRSIINSNPLYTEQKVLIQRKPAQWRDICEDVNLISYRNFEQETLIHLVAEGELNYAMCKYSVARLIAPLYPNIDMATGMGDLPVGWVVRNTSTELLNAVNQWLAHFKNSRQYAILYDKYYKSKLLQIRIDNKHFANRTGIISEYDELFKKYSSEIRWDWRLLASLVYQESKFDPEARSKVGAYGLMQMMPTTMEDYGVDTCASPERHIAAGVKYIKYLDRLLADFIPDENERIKFVLAAYNIGPGHILDAQRLADKFGKNSAVWEDNVDSCLLRKIDPVYYTDPEVHCGRCRGKETYAFVTQVMKRYGHYRMVL
jgi:membrane-bound lytic murein transglycosylase F